jgi:hypothetical protein
MEANAILWDCCEDGKLASIGYRIMCVVAGSNDLYRYSLSNNKHSIGKVFLPPNTSSKGGLPGYKITEVDQKRMNVYGDYVHQSKGSHLDGNIQDNAAWQTQLTKAYHTVMPTL